MVASAACSENTDGTQCKWQGIKNPKNKKLPVLLPFCMIEPNFSSAKSVKPETARLLRDPILICLCLLEVPGDPGSPAEPSLISPRRIAQSEGPAAGMAGFMLPLQAKSKLEDEPTVPPSPARIEPRQL